MKNVLVTGGAGGIGSTLSLGLTKRAYNVTAYDNLNNGYEENLLEDGKAFCKFVFGDIRNTQNLIDLIELYNINCIVHLAAITALPVCESDPNECFSVNVAGTASVLDAARKKGIHVIVASTSAIYENNDKSEAPFREDIKVVPRLMYPLSKKLMEDVIESYKVNYGMDITVLRFFNVFGPRQDIHRKSPPLINYIVKQIKNNQTLNFFSDGNQARDYVHVNDVVSMIELCILNENSKGQTLNLCTGTLTSVHDIIGYAKSAFGEIPEVVFNKPKDFWSGYDSLFEGKNSLSKSVVEREVNKYSLGSYERANQILNWTPDRNIEKLMISTMKENFEKYVKV